MQRCRDTSASWERPAFLRRLEEFATAHPDLDTTPLVAALNGDPAAAP